jgi:uncharacterized protein YciI
LLKSEINNLQSEIVLERSRMYALAILRYRRPLEEIVKVVDEHRAYLGDLKKKGILLASGPLDPRTGGELLLRVPDNDVQGTLDRVRDGDPFVKHGVAQYELMAWNVMLGVDGLNKL